MTTLLLVLILVAVIAPLTKVSYCKISTEVAANRYELLLTIVRDAVNHVDQIATTSEEEFTGEEKKTIAVRTATRAAQVCELPDKLHGLIEDLIESQLWREEEVEDTEDDFE